MRLGDRYRLPCPFKELYLWFYNLFMRSFTVLLECQARSNSPGCAHHDVSDIYSNITSSARSRSTRESGSDSLLTAPASTSHRDMGTQMTPIPSLRHSRCTTPGINLSPSRHNTPARSNRRATSLGATNGDMLELHSFHLEKLGHHRPLDCQRSTLDRNSNWSTREEEEEESAACLRLDGGDLEENGALLAWALAWEDAERAKYTAR